MTTSWIDPKTGTTVRVGDVLRDKKPLHGPRYPLRTLRVACFMANWYPDGTARMQARTEDYRWKGRLIKGHLVNIRATDVLKRFDLVSRAPSADPNVLKPCAHCGSADLGMTDSDCPGGVVVVECKECGARGPIPDGGAPDGSGMANEARTRWNERATEAKAASGYPSAGHPWADFLHHRGRVLLMWEREGKRPEESARLMSMDPGQVRMILDHVRSEEAKASHG